MQIIIWFRKSLKKSLTCSRESMELDQQEAAAASLSDDPIVLERESITLFSEGISIMIPSKQKELHMTVPDFERNRFNGTTEFLKRKSDKFKQQIVKEMARRIIAFFIQPEDHKDKLRKDEELELIRAHKPN
ncbi:hypothetical protein MKW92_025215 [Papaver armeniacum]|nr:hypothetical protein MKW92_025215 [Papaver armeniacum]